MVKPEKRKETDKTGSTPTNKDARKDTETQNDASFSTVDTGSTPTNEEIRKVTSTQIDASFRSVENGLSYADVVAETSTGDDASVLESSTTIKSKYDPSHQWAGKKTGLLRDQITVDINTIDGSAMKDQLSMVEQMKIYQKMGLKSSNYNGTCPGFDGHPTYTYRLKEMIDIKTIPSADITISRLKRNADGTKSVQKICCRVRGIDDEPRKSTRQDSAFDPNIKWLKFEKTRYEFEATQMVDWMRSFGQLLTEPTEETEKLVLSEPEDSDDDDLCSVLDGDFKAGLPEVRGTGTYKAKIKLTQPPPQYLPIYGQKVRVHYQGIRKMCTKCYRNGHIKKECKGDRVTWIEYVKSFVESHPNIPKEMYGRWWDVLRKEFPNFDPTDIEDMEAAAQFSQSPTKESQIESITNALQHIRNTEKQANLKSNQAESTVDHVVVEEDDENEINPVNAEGIDANPINKTNHDLLPLPSKEVQSEGDFAQAKATVTGTIPKKRVGRPTKKPNVN